MKTSILIVWILCFINFPSYSDCNVTSCQAEESDYVNVGEELSFDFIFFKESFSNFIDFHKDGRHIARYEISEISGKLYPNTAIYETSLKGRFTVDRTKDGNTTTVISNVHISDNGTYSVITDYGDYTFCRRIFVVGMEELKGRDVIKEGTTVGYLGYPTLSDISLHKDWNISCEYLFDGKTRSISRNNYELSFLIFDDWMIIPRASRDFDQKTITYQCTTYDNDTFKVERVLSVNYSICNSSIALSRTNQLIEDSSPMISATTFSVNEADVSNEPVDDSGMPLVEKVIIGGYILAITVVTSVTVVCVMRCFKKCRQSKQGEMKREPTDSLCGNRRSTMYLHPKDDSFTLYDLPFTCSTSSDRNSATINDYLDMTGVKTPSFETQKSK